MKKIKLLLVAIFSLALIFSACSKKAQDSVIGKWKMPPVEEMAKMGVKVETVFEFTTDKMIVDQSVNGQKQPTFSATYIVKSDDGVTLSIEATSSDTKDKVNFTIKPEGKTLTMVGPDSQPVKLEKL